MDQISFREQKINSEIPFWLKLVSRLCSAIVGVLESFLRILSRFSLDFYHLAERFPYGGELNSYLKECRESSGLRHVVFYCSSAGEYEQAVPLIRRFEARGYQPLIFFFSRSGLRFARVRKEAAPFFLSPPDRLSYWRKIFDNLSVSQSILVRHEFWPAFLTVASSTGSGVSLINGSPSLKDRQSALSRFVKSVMMMFFSRIYVVAESDFRFFVDSLGLKPENVLIAGDSKYDRVFERSQEFARGRNHLNEVLKFGDDAYPRSRLIVGSAWEPDYELALSALEKVCALNTRHTIMPELIIALHEPGESALLKLESSCQKRGFSSIRFSELKRRGTVSLEKADNFKVPVVVIIDSVGLLSELYASAQLALVGGALHHKIHNVLEPACYGLAMAFGPRYKNSGEAILMVESQCAKVVETGDDLARWWIGQAEADHKDGQKVSDHLKGYLGATEKIMCDLLREQAKNAR